MQKEMTTAFAAGIGLGVVVGCVLKEILNYFMPSQKNIDGNLSDSTSVFSDEGKYKMVIVVRNDLKMGKGKAAAQCAHGALSCAEKAMVKNKDIFYAWKSCGQPKVIVKVNSEQELVALMQVAVENDLICNIIQDAGRTQVARGSRTVLAIGPVKPALSSHLWEGPKPTS